MSVFSMWFHYFFQSNLKKKLTKRLCKVYVGRRLKNAPGVNFRQNFAFARKIPPSPLNPPPVIPPSLPASARDSIKKKSLWSAVIFKKIHDLDGYVILRIACSDSCQLAITWLPKIKDSCDNGLLSYFPRYWPTGVRTDSHETTIFF